jgi:CRP-like cAMP-binding protein
MNFKTLFVLLRKTKTRSFAKGELIITEGSCQLDIYYIRRGLVRSYLNNAVGKDVTFQLYHESSVFSNAHFLLFNEPSKFNYQALEDTKTYAIGFNSFQKMAALSPELLEFNRTYLGKRLLQQSFQRIESFVFMSPEERYIKYLKEHPKLANRVPDKYIANVLGITPVSLSRIRSRITSKKI